MGLPWYRSSVVLGLQMDCSIVLMVVRHRACEQRISGSSMTLVQRPKSSWLRMDGIGRIRARIEKDKPCRLDGQTLGTRYSQCLTEIGDGGLKVMLGPGTGGLEYMRFGGLSTIDPFRIEQKTINRRCCVLYDCCLVATGGICRSVVSGWCVIGECCWKECWDFDVMEDRVGRVDSIVERERPRVGGRVKQWLEHESATTTKSRVHLHSTHRP